MIISKLFFKDARELKSHFRSDGRVRDGCLSSEVAPRRRARARKIRENKLTLAIHLV
jgi:hypothetical protein